MNINELSVSLPAKDDSGKTHTFVLTEKDGELVFATENGQEVARISVSTMTKSVRDDEGDFHEKWSDNFYISFRAVEAVAKRECDALAFVDSPNPIFLGEKS